MKLIRRNFFALTMAACLLAPSAIAGEPADEFSGRYKNVDGYFPQAKDSSKVEIIREGNAYRLVGTKIYDDYRFVKTADGVLEDEKKHLGKIYLGNAIFRGRTKQVRILKVDFCYNYFYLLRLD
mgnify:CR=1 FL=1